MKVLVQEWFWPGKGCLMSLSKDRAQLDATYAEAVAEDDGVKREDDPDEITISDDSPYAEMVQDGTVFLHGDEMDVVYDSPEYQ